jgi:hypothetical protein
LTALIDERLEVLRPAELCAAAAAWRQGWVWRRPLVP